MCYSPLKVGHQAPPSYTNSGAVNGGALNGVVENGNCKENSGDGCCGSGGGECQSSSSCSSLSDEDVKEQLCYACNLTFSDMGCDVNVLPPDITHHVSEQMKRDKMKESIKDFLLED